MDGFARSRMSMGITARLYRATARSKSWPQLAEDRHSIKLVNLVIAGP
jgi:hypothetical protein